MANDAEDYIAAVADACAAAGLTVTDYWSDDIDPRDGAITLSKDPAAPPVEDWPGEDWRDSYTLGWDEEKGWFYGEPKDNHGELHNLLFFGDGALPRPSEVAETARRIITGETGRDERYRMMQHTRWRDQEDDDGFEEQLAAYRAAKPGEE
jgi:hypothetical protein